MGLDKQNPGGGLYPGTNAQSVFKQAYGTSGEVLYTVPNGRILFISSGTNLVINGHHPSRRYFGGRSDSESNGEDMTGIYCTGGDVISNEGTSYGKLVGIEFDA